MYHNFRSNNRLYFSVLYIVSNIIAVLVTCENVELFNFAQFFINEWETLLEVIPV